MIYWLAKNDRWVPLGSLVLMFSPVFITVPGVIAAFGFVIGLFGLTAWIAERLHG